MESVCIGLSAAIRCTGYERPVCTQPANTSDQSSTPGIDRQRSSQHQWKVTLAV